MEELNVSEGDIQRVLGKFDNSEHRVTTSYGLKRRLQTVNSSSDTDTGEVRDSKTFTHRVALRMTTKDFGKILERKMPVTVDSSIESKYQTLKQEGHADTEPPSYSADVFDAPGVSSHAARYF